MSHQYLFWWHSDFNLFFFFFSTAKVSRGINSTGLVTKSAHTNRTHMAQVNQETGLEHKTLGANSSLIPTDLN